jgi:carbonic anhydrase
MKKSFEKLMQGYHAFREKYATGDRSVMKRLAYGGQKPETMVVACCDSRVDPALILQTDPGDLFIVRNIANIIPPYESDEGHHGTSAALEFGVCYLNVKHLIILGHSQCGGMQALLDSDSLKQNDFITDWISLINVKSSKEKSVDTCAKDSLYQSYKNCFTFPWIKERLDTNLLSIHLWFFDIEEGQILNYSFKNKEYKPLVKGE